MTEPAACLYMSLRDVDPRFEKEYLDWLVGEHLPDLLAVPGVLRAHRYESHDGSSPKYLAIYELESPAVLGSETWARAANTERARALKEHWDMKARNIFRLVGTGEHRPG